MWGLSRSLSGLLTFVSPSKACHSLLPDTAPSAVELSSASLFRLALLSQPQGQYPEPTDSRLTWMPLRNADSGVSLLSSKSELLDVPRLRIPSLVPCPHFAAVVCPGSLIGVQHS